MSVATVFAVILLFIPLPEIVVSILFILTWGLCMLLMFMVRKYKKDLLSLPRKILFLTLFILAIEISYSRIIILYEMRIRINPDTSFKYMYIINIIMAVTLLILAFRFVRKRAAATAEMAVRFSEDEFYSNLDGCSKLLTGNMKALIFMYVVSIAGGCLYGVIQYGYSIQNALNIVSLPALIAAICGSMCMTCLGACAGYYAMKITED
jgi:flagellar biosynthesis protein FlhA